MNRFRRKSDRKRKESEELERLAAPVAPLPSARIQQRTQLEAQDFRTSLILPHLTRRFTLLRSEDGRLVSLDTMQEHLAAQRQTGNLTSFEADAVLAQYRFQTQYEDPGQPLDKAAAWMERNNNAKGRLDSIDDESARTSVFSSSTSDHDLPRSASSFGGSSATSPFPYSGDLSPPTPTEPITIANFRRGGGSMFGARVMSSSQMKMSKSMSSVSLASAGSTVRRKPKPAEGGEEEAVTSESRGPEPGPELEGAVVPQVEGLEGAPTTVITPPEERAALISEDDLDQPFVDASDELAIPQLSTRQLHRISHVLDDIEVELSRTYLRMTGYESDEEPGLGLLSSPEVSFEGTGEDGEFVDPFFHASPLLGSSSASPQLLPSSPAFESSLETSPVAGLATPLPSIVPIPSIHSPDPSFHSPAASTSTLPPSHSPSGDDRLFDLPTLPARRGSGVTSTKHESYTSNESHSVPAAYTFPAVPTRSGSSVSDHVSSPSTRNSVVTRSGSKGSDTRPYAATSASTGPSATFSHPNGSQSSIGSVGSSYHGEVVASDDELALPAQRSSRLGIEGDEETNAAEVLKDDKGDDEDHLRAVSSMSRRPSTELLKDLGPSLGLGNANLVLDDLVVIQDSLVRSASKRAERNAAGTSPLPTSIEFLPSSEAAEVPVTEEEQEDVVPEMQSPGSLVLAGPRKSSLESASRESFEESVANTSASSATIPAEPSAVIIEQPVIPEDESLDAVDELPLSSNVAGLGIETTAPPRVARNMAPRGPTPSVLIRDVRTQADLATNALKPPAAKVIRRSKSVRRIAISQPQFVSGPSGIPSVPIIHPAIRLEPATERDGKDGRTKSKPGIGLRFKMLMTKQSRDQLPTLNGDEVTPFETIDFDTSVSPTATPPFTPPSQSSAEFASSPDYPRTPTNDFPRTPERHLRTPTSALSPVGRSSVDEGSPSTPKGDGSIKRAMSRFGRRKQSEEGGLVAHDWERSGSVTPVSPASNYSPSTTPMRKASVETDPVGLGFSLNSRAPTSYDIGSIRRRREQTDVAEMPRTAPLDVRHQTPSPLDVSMANNAAPSTSQSAPLPGLRSLRRPETNSTSSMREMKTAAQDLGLPADQAQELVDLSYNRVTASPQATPSTNETKHRRGASSVSSTGSGSKGRVHRSPGSRSIHERSPTPPPGAHHRKKASIERNAAPVPSLPEGMRIPGSRSGELASASTLGPPSSPSNISINSFRSSGYAGSVFGDYYADETEDAREQRKSMMFGGLMEGEPKSPGSYSREDGGDGLFSTFIDGLRKERPGSTISDTFHSRHSSFDSNGPSSPPGTGGRSHEPFNFQMRHHRRNRSSQSSQVPSARQPSVYVRDEQRLEALAFEGGIAQESEGNFIVRPRPTWQEPLTQTGEEDDIIVK